jgi:hypothetical protein
MMLSDSLRACIDARARDPGGMNQSSGTWLHKTYSLQLPFIEEVTWLFFR